MDKLVLFDVNETLVRDTKDVSEYVSESIRNIYGTLVEVNLSKYIGMTSQETAEAVLLENGMPKDEIEQKLVRYTEDLFYTYYNVAGHDRQTLFEGAGELLEELSKKGVLIGIATGESEKIARFRIEKAGLSNYFAFGAFAKDGRSAEDIVGKALEKAKSEFSFSGNAALVCSSPNFVSAAKRFGIKSAGIANGKFSGEELKNAGADVATKSLKDKGKIIQLLF
jgi:phosphoglycolate phosphatase-like HAD superfamily hydrolase